MLRKLCFILLLSTTVTLISADSEKTEWHQFLNKERNITVDIDSSINSTVERLEAINSVFRKYVTSFKSANSTLPFDLMINSTTFSLKKFDSFTSLVNVNNSSKNASFEGNLVFRSRKNSTNDIQNIKINLTCIISEQDHKCSALYQDEPSDMAQLVGFAIFAISSLVLALCAYCCFYAYCEYYSEEPRNNNYVRRLGRDRLPEGASDNAEDRVRMLLAILEEGDEEFDLLQD